MKKQLFGYQSEAIKNIFSKFKQGHKRVVFQLATGGGKTFTATELIHFFLKNNPNFEALFLVHRVELLNQFKNTFEKAHPEFEVGVIDRETRLKRFDLRINVGMIETSIRRLKKNNNFFGNKTRLLIVDECHNSSFDKIFEYFENCLVVGLTATPMRLSKKNPMNLVYSDIVCGPSIQYLIDNNSLCPNKTFVIDNGVKNMKFKMRGNDFTEQSIFDEFSKSKHINNVVNAYEEKSLNQKTIIFNASIEHSDLVNKAFKLRGYNSKHLDGATSKSDRDNILKWFHETPDAILQNVGVLTMGFDEPSILTVIMNRPTASLPLWLQCTGRGSRRYFSKDYFTIIDLGGNAERLGDWSSDFDWEDIFRNAKQKLNDGEGVAPIKDCPSCGYIMPIQKMECPECGHKFIKEIEEDVEEIKLKLLTDNFVKKINVHKIDGFVKKMNWNDYAGLHMIKDVFIKDVKESNLQVDSDAYNQLHSMYMNEVENWCKITGKEFNKWHQDFANNIILKN